MVAGKRVAIAAGTQQQPGAWQSNGGGSSEEENCKQQKIPDNDIMLDCIGHLLMLA